MKLRWLWEDFRNSVLDRVGIDYYTYWIIKNNILAVVYMGIFLLLLTIITPIAAYGMYYDTILSILDARVLVLD